MHNYLGAYPEPCHLSKIELFEKVNRWEPINILLEKLYFGGLWIPLCALAVYLMAKKDILRLGKLIVEEDKYMRSSKNYHP